MYIMYPSSDKSHEGLRTSSTGLNSTGPKPDILDDLKALPVYILSKLSNSYSLLQVPSRATTVRPTHCNACFQRKYHFLISSKTICRTPNNSPITLLIFIHTSHDHQNQRDAIRKTWASLSMNNTSPLFRYVFLLGSSEKEYNEKIQTENNIHHDLALQNFRDTYRNLTLKTLMGFHWHSRFCSNANYVMKTDDDIYVNVTNILRIIKQPNMQAKILGTCCQKANPIRGESKWSAKHWEYPDKKYPGFCNGPGYVMSATIAMDIDMISMNVPFFHLEDVYVALCASRLRVPLQNIPNFIINYFPLFGNTCGKYGVKDLFVVHGFTPQKMLNIWKLCKESSKHN